MTLGSGLEDSVERRVDLRRLCSRRELPVFLFSTANLWTSKLEEFEGETVIRMEGLGVNSWIFLLASSPFNKVF